VTCTPYGINTHRLLVHAKRIKVPQEWYDMLEEGDRPPRMFTPSVTTPVWIYGLFGLGLGILVLSVILFVRWRRRKKKERKAEE